MSLRIISIFLFIFYIGTAPAIGQDAEAAATDQEDQDKTAAADEENLSVMDLLRKKLTGFTSTSIQIIASGSTTTSGDWITIQRNAEVKIGLDKSLLADLIRYNPKENKLAAEGNVVLLENDLRIGGDSLEFNLSDNTGTVTNPYIESGEGYVVSGERLEKQGPDTYTLHGAKLTSCNQPTPQWQMAASSITIKAGENATLRNMRLRMFDAVPVFYLPWASVPLDKQRGSGFLFPEWGTGDYHGFWIKNRYFWAINDSHDATLGHDYYEKRGHRYSGEYRNNLGDTGATFVNFYYIEDENFYANEPGRVRNRYEALVKNRTNLPYGFKIFVNLEFLSDNTYRRDFINRDVYFSPLYRKDLSFSNTIDGYSFLVNYNDINRFRTRNRISQIRYLPKLDFRAREKQIPGTPLYATFSANFVRPAIREIFKRAEFEKEDEIEEEAYNRYDFQGEILMPLKTFAPWLTITPRILGRTTQYSRSYNEERTEIVDESLSRRYWDTGVDVIGPVFSKIFGNPATSRNLYKHIIEPRLTYTYRSEIDEDSQDRIIVLDQEDTFFRVHELKWTLNNIILHKSNNPDNPLLNRTTEILRIGVSQYISAEEDLLTTYDKRYVFDPSQIEAATRYSPLMIDVSARIFNNVRANANIEYDTIENEFINYTLSGSLNVRNLNYRVGWYRSVGVVRFDRVGVFRSQTNRFVNSGDVSLFEGLLRFRGAYDYDFERERILNYLAGVDINGQCLGASFEIRKLNLLGQDDLQTRFSISIGGLGKILGGMSDR